MFDDDASEEEREDLFLDTGERKNNKSRESRKEREEKLKRMMEDDGLIFQLVFIQTTLLTN